MVILSSVERETILFCHGSTQPSLASFGGQAGLTMTECSRYRLEHLWDFFDDPPCSECIPIFFEELLRRALDHCTGFFGCIERFQALCHEAGNQPCKGIPCAADRQARVAALQFRQGAVRPGDAIDGTLKEDDCSRIACLL